MENFKEIYGENVVDSIHLYLIEKEIMDEFNTVKNNLGDLFEFSVKYGIYEIVKFLYEDMNIEYNHNIFFKFNHILNSENVINSETNLQAVTTGNSNNKFKIENWDKFTTNRKVCLNYLMKMKKYSKIRYENKSFYYKFRSFY